MRIKDKAKPKAPAMEPGVYVGICVGVIDLGEQYSEKFKNYANKVQLVWEFPTETIEVDGKQEPRQLSKEFTISTSKKGNLRGFLGAWNGKSYSDEEFGEVDLFEQIGKACMVNVVNSESGEYSNIESVMPLMKGYPVPECKTTPILWDMDAWDDEVFQKLPEWVQEKIKKSTQYQKDHAPNTSVEVKPEAPASEGACPI
jgi:hypothetical protein